MPTPTNRRMQPTPSSTTTPTVGRSANSPAASATAATLSTIGAAVRLPASREGGSVAPSRTAAIGGTRVARRAGEIVASTVMPTPSSSETITVLRLNTVPVLGRSTPRALNSAFRPLAISKPSSRPTIAATSPVTKPSSSTERNTCLRDAPSVRSVASSRTRCATVMDSVLKMTNDADDQRDRREREQEVLEEREPVVGLRGGGLAGLGAGLDLGRRRQQRLDLVGDLGFRDPRASASGR